MFSGFLTVFHVIVCLILIVVVLMQSDQSMNLSGMFGGASQSALGNRPQSVLSRATTILAIVFMLTSVVFAVMPSGSGQGGGALQSQQSGGALPSGGQQAPAQQTAPSGNQQQGQTSNGGNQGSQSAPSKNSSQPSPSPGS